MTTRDILSIRNQLSPLIRELTDNIDADPSFFESFMGQMIERYNIDNKDTTNLVLIRNALNSCPRGKGTFLRSGITLANISDPKTLIEILEFFHPTKPTIPEYFSRLFSSHSTSNSTELKNKELQGIEEIKVVINELSKGIEDIKGVINELSKVILQIDEKLD
jgi:hypothetical protein